MVDKHTPPISPPDSNDRKHQCKNTTASGPPPFNERVDPSRPFEDQVFKECPGTDPSKEQLEQWNISKRKRYEEACKAFPPKTTDIILPETTEEDVTEKEETTVVDGSQLVANGGQSTLPLTMDNSPARSKTSDVNDSPGARRAARMKKSGSATDNGRAEKQTVTDPQDEARHDTVPNPAKGGGVDITDDNKTNPDNQDDLKIATTSSKIEDTDEPSNPRSPQQGVTSVPTVTCGFVHGLTICPVCEPEGDAPEDEWDNNLDPAFQSAEQKVLDAQNEFIRKELQRDPEWLAATTHWTIPIPEGLEDDTGMEPNDATDFKNATFSNDPGMGFLSIKDQLLGNKSIPIGLASHGGVPKKKYESQFDTKPASATLTVPEKPTEVVPAVPYLTFKPHAAALPGHLYPSYPPYPAYPTYAGRCVPNLFPAYPAYPAYPPLSTVCKCTTNLEVEPTGEDNLTTAKLSIPSEELDATVVIEDSSKKDTEKKSGKLDNNDLDDGKEVEDDSDDNSKVKLIDAEEYETFKKVAVSLNPWDGKLEPILDAGCYVHDLEGEESAKIEMEQLAEHEEKKLKAKLEAANVGKNGAAVETEGEERRVDGLSQLLEMTVMARNIDKYLKKMDATGGAGAANAATKTAPTVATAGTTSNVDKPPAPKENPRTPTKGSVVEKTERKQSRDLSKVMPQAHASGSHEEAVGAAEGETDGADGDDASTSMPAIVSGTRNFMMNQEYNGSSSSLETNIKKGVANSLKDTNARSKRAKHGEPASEDEDIPERPDTKKGTFTDSPDPENRRTEAFAALCRRQHSSNGEIARVLNSRFARFSAKYPDLSPRHVSHYQRLLDVPIMQQSMTDERIKRIIGQSELNISKFKK